MVEREGEEEIDTGRAIEARDEGASLKARG
jgi:hypothetical protein